jgi:hypothetical protein
MDLSGIDSGENFVEVIHAAIQSSDVVLAVIGKEWLTCAGPGGRRLDDPNDLVRTEIAAAFERDLPVIPVLVDGTTMPPAAALPAALKPLARRDAHEITDERWAYDVGRLIEATGKRAGKPVTRKRHTWRPVAAGLVIVAIAGGVFVWRAREAPATGPEDSVAPTAQASTLQAGHATGAARDDASLPPAALAGEWSAEVTYDWGATHTERFQFTCANTIVFSPTFSRSMWTGCSRMMPSSRSRWIRRQAADCDSPMRSPIAVALMPGSVCSRSRIRRSI